MRHKNSSHIHSNFRLSCLRWTCISITDRAGAASPRQTVFTLAVTSHWQSLVRKDSVTSVSRGTGRSVQ